MKKLKFMLAVALAAMLTACNGQSEVKNESNGNGMLETIMTRTSIRQYTDQPVEKEKIEAMLLTSSMRHPKCLTSFSKSKSGCIIFCSSVRNSVLLAVPATPSVLMSMLMMVLAMSITLSTLSPIPLSLMIRSSSL